MTALVTITDVQSVTMTSLDLVEFINSQRGDSEATLAHSDFLKKVPQVLGEAVAGNFSGYYRASNGKQNPMYTFPKREACLMAMSYSYDIQSKVFDRMTALEQERASHAITIPNFYNPAEAARAWAAQYEARLLAEQTKAEIGSRREATAMNTASQASKKAARLEVELDQSMRYASVKRMEGIYRDQKFNWRTLRAKSAELGLSPLDTFDANYGTVKAYHADVWRKAYAVEICNSRQTGKASFPEIRK